MTPPHSSIFAVELLESRRLLAGFQLNIDFAPEGAEVAPGYVADYGRQYGDRGNGNTFGWRNDNRVSAVERDHEYSPNQRFDTFIQLWPEGNWSAEVPNGTYLVRLIVGDATDKKGRYTVDVEGQRVVDALPTDRRRFIDRIATVDVTDGKLTLTSGLGTGVNKLASIEIKQIAPSSLIPSGIGWTTDGAPLARTKRIEPGSVQLGDKLYVFGGYNSGNSDVTRSAEVLDLATGTWSELASLPENAAESHAGIASDGERYIYWVAGQKGPREGAATNTAWRYDTLSNTWDRFVDLPEGRYGGALAFYNNVLYFFGGNDESRSTATTSHWAASTRSKNPSWIERAAMPAANDHHAVAVVNSMIYSFGGEDGHGTTYDQHKNVFAYNPAIDAWTRKADLPTASSHFEGGTHAIGDKVLLIAGRIDIADGTWTDEVRLYDTITDKWTILDPLPDARLGPSSAIHNGRVYITNGYSEPLGLTDVAYWGTLSGF